MLKRTNKFIEIPTPQIKHDSGMGPATSSDYIKCVFCDWSVELRKMRDDKTVGYCDCCGIEYRLLTTGCVIRPVAVSDKLRKALYDLKEATR